MKFKIGLLSVLSLIFVSGCSTNAVIVSENREIASVKKELLPCTAKDLKELNAKLNEFKKKKEFVHQNYLVNSKGQVVGYFAWDGNTEAHAEVYEFLDTLNDDSTCANEYYYWSNRDEHYKTVSADPKTFKKGKTYLVNQDEGQLQISVLGLDTDNSVIAKIANVSTADKAVRITNVKFVERR